MDGEARVLEIIEILRWPVVALVLGGFGMLIFRTPLVAMISRIKSIEKFALKFTEPQQIPARAEPDIPDLTQEEEPDDTFLATEVRMIESQMRQLGITEPDATITFLKRVLAGSLINQRFLQLQGGIYTSQLALLTTLNGVEHVTREQARTFYKAGADLWPDLYASDSFDRWLTYLKSFGAVWAEGDRIGIAPFGRAFLEWRLRLGLLTPTRG